MRTFFWIFLLVFSLPCFAQENELSSDELFTKARTEAFDNKDYPKAIALIKKAIAQSPDYDDLSIFLARIYTWQDKVDSAASIFQGLEEKGADSEDFYLAYGSMLYWNDQYAKAESILLKGLESHRQSEDLLLLQAKLYNAQDKYQMASGSIEKLLAINPRHSEARDLANRVKDYVAKNAIGISYNFTHFDKQFSDDWHITSLSYKRATSIGSVIFKANYANKFASNGFQAELEAYPRISDMFYMYLGVGYSDDVGIFPKYRTGASLYANLPASFEGELGFRQLHFSSDIWMYTASLGKYYSNLWFNLRTYLTPSNSNISHSYTGTVRYYTGGANDYLGFQIGTGISPEDNRNNLLIESYKLKTFKVGAEYNFSIARNNLLGISATYFNQEYKPKEKGNQLDLSVSYSRVF